MHRKRAIFLSLLVLATTAWTPMAEAGRSDQRRYERHDRHYRSHDHGYRDRSGVALGAGLALGASLLWLSTYSPPPSRPSRVVVVTSPPPVVIAPPAPRYAPPPPEVWYYCRSEGAYYPYVPTCSTPWEVVPVQ
jgi:hypothetical protein